MLQQGWALSASLPRLACREGSGALPSPVKLSPAHAALQAELLRALDRQRWLQKQAAGTHRCCLSLISIPSPWGGSW